MEHRLHVRKPAKYMAKLVIDGYVVATEEVVDISLNGLGIKRPKTTFKRGQIVVVNLIKSGYPRAISRCFRSKVVRTGITTLGLVLDCGKESQATSSKHGNK